MRTRYRGLLALLLLSTSPALAAVAFDAATDCGYTETSPQTCNHTTSGTNRLLLACVTLFTHTATVNASNPTYNGVAMTLVDSQANATGSIIAYLYRLVNPTIGTNGYSLASSDAGAMNSLLVSYTGVDQTTPLGTAAKASGQSMQSSVTATTAAGEMPFDCMAMRDNDDVETPTVGANQTQRASHNTALFWWTKASDQDGANGGAMTWDWTNNNEDWVAISASIKATALAATTTRRRVIIR